MKSPLQNSFSRSQGLFNYWNIDYLEININSNDTADVIIPNHLSVTKYRYQWEVYTERKRFSLNIIL